MENSNTNVESINTNVENINTNVESINKLGMRYALQGILIVAVLSAIVLALMHFCRFENLLTPLIVSATFSVLVDSADAIVWSKVARKSPESLPTFYTAVSGFRMLLALAVMFVYYLIEGGDSMLAFFLVFMAFYVLLLAHHVWFFTRSTKHS